MASMLNLLRQTVTSVAHLALFPSLDSHGAKSVINSVSSNGWKADGWEPRHFISCRNKCESFEPDLTTQQSWHLSRPLPRGLINYANAPAPERTGTLDRMCNNNAVQFPNRAARFPGGAAGVNEISDCREDTNTPSPNLHLNPQLGGPVVCSPCKEFRANRFEWRLEGLLYGVCVPCRNYIVANEAIAVPGEPACDCGPRPWRFGPANAGDRQSSVLPPTAQNNAQNDVDGEPRHYHMCRRHIMAHWRPIADQAYGEWERRARLKIVKRKKKNNPFSRPKTRTPWQRAKATRVAPNVSQEPDPRCFCGAKIGQLAHRKYQPGAAGTTAGTDIRNRVRNCLGCNKYVRRW